MLDNSGHRLVILKRTGPYLDLRSSPEARLKPLGCCTNGGQSEIDPRPYNDP